MHFRELGFITHHQLISGDNFHICYSHKAQNMTQITGCIIHLTACFRAPCGQNHVDFFVRQQALWTGI